MFDEFGAKPLKAKSWEHYRDIFLRRRWWLALPVFLVWAGTWVTSWFLPASYKSETLILVERQRVPSNYVTPNVTNDLQQRVQSMTQQILSRTRLMGIIEQFQLYQELKSHLSMDQMVDKMRKDIKIDSVRTPGPPGQQTEVSAFKISYTSGNPRVAQQVTGQLTSLFIDENLRARTQQSEDTTSFLENELEEARKTLSEQEQRIREFKSNNLGTLPDQLGSNMNILSGLQTHLQEELQGLNQSKQQNLYFTSLLDQYRSIKEAQKQGSNDPNVPPALDGELSRLKTQLADVRSHYTERHPDYRKLKGQIAEVEKMKQQMANEFQAAAAQSNAPERNKDNSSKDGGTGVHPSSFAELREMSPMLQLEGQLKANELEIQNRQKLIDRLETTIQEYQARLNTAPIKEQQLEDLTRDYDQSRANYNSLLAKRNQSELATSLEKRQQGEQFHVIDPPSLPMKPYKPDRLMFSFAGLLAGVFVAAIATAVAELGEDRIFDESDLKELVSAPVLTEIPSLPTELETTHRRRQARFEWMGATAMLLITTAGFVFTYYRG